MTKKFTLNKNDRLKSRKLIEQLFKKGDKMHSGYFKAFYLNQTGSVNSLQLGVGVSGKTFKKAVDRNRIKRLIKESFRLQKNSLKDKLENHQKQLSVFILYTGNEVPAYREVYEKIGALIKKLQNILD